MKKTLKSRFLFVLVSIVLIASIFVLSDKILPPPMGNNEANAFFASGMPFPGCLDNYKTFNHSTTFKADAAWNLNFMPDRSNGSLNYQHEQFLDINGDGLVDYIYADNYHQDVYNSYPARGIIQECVYLNTGSGWESAYKCYASYDYTLNDGMLHYYGDCADMS